MLVIENKSTIQISTFLKKIACDQSGYEHDLDKVERKKNGVFLTNSIDTVENLIDIVTIDSDILKKNILEPSCGQGIIILKLLSDIYLKFPDILLISNFITNNIFFVDIQQEMVEKTKSNIRKLFSFLFDEDFNGSFNGIVWDFTDKASLTLSLFEDVKITPFSNLYKSFDYVIGNPPYVSLYGRRDKKENEQQRINYLNNYNQFPNYVKNGKLNLKM